MIDLDTLAFPSIPMDYLQDHDILEIYLKRLLLLGWRSRKQFEESWMALLGVFSLSKDDLSDAEVAALAQVSTLSVSAITGAKLKGKFFFSIANYFSFYYFRFTASNKFTTITRPSIFFLTYSPFQRFSEFIFVFKKRSTVDHNSKYDQ